MYFINTLKIYVAGNRMSRNIVKKNYFMFTTPAAPCRDDEKGVNPGNNEGVVYPPHPSPRTLFYGRAVAFFLN
jgi:hypothetical protein